MTGEMGRLYGVFVLWILYVYHCVLIASRSRVAPKTK